MVDSIRRHHPSATPGSRAGCKGPANPARVASICSGSLPLAAAGLLDHVRRHLKLDHRVDELAARACMSPWAFRALLPGRDRRQPGACGQRLRVDAACAALQARQPSVQRIAEDCGFGNTERMRRSFQRLLGRPPAAFRKANERGGTSG